MRSSDRGIRRIVTAGLLLAITLLLTFTSVAFIPLPTPAGSATIGHIPAIIGGILEGPLVGLIVGLGFGFGCLMSPIVTAVTNDPLVIVLPRLLIGVTSAWAFVLLRRANKVTLGIMLGLLVLLLFYYSYQVGTHTLWLGILIAVLTIAAAVLVFRWARGEQVTVISLAVAGVVGSLTNTILVLSAAVWRKVPGIGPEVALGVGLTQGIPEAVVSAIVVVAIVTALRQIGKRRMGSRL
jgi:uncharacterized membrane protein